MSISKLKGKSAIRSKEQASNTAKNQKCASSTSRTAKHSTSGNTAGDSRLTTTSIPAPISVTITATTSDSTSTSTVAPVTGPAAPTVVVAAAQQSQTQSQPQSQSQAQSQTQLQQSSPHSETSLLRIEAFAPNTCANTALRRPIARSYSTLSNTTSVRRASDCVTRHVGQLVGAAIDGALPRSLSKASTRPTRASRTHRQPVPALARQRSTNSKCNASSASSRPTTAAAVNGSHTPTVACAASLIALSSTTLGSSSNGNGNSSGSGAVVTPLPNGICRIARLPKEQEKLPDRINYDRRGLTAIPIFENEPNLRLLSLQHNLINVFHIPRQHAPPAELAQQPKPTPAADAANKGGQILVNAHDENARNGGLTQQLNVASSGRANMATAPTAAALAARFSARTTTANRTLRNLTPTPTPTPPPPPTPTPTPTHATHSTHLTAPTMAVNQLLRRNGLLQRHINFQAPNLPQPPLQLQQAQQYRFGMKKSKSFITNYSRHLSHMKRNLQQSYLSQAGVMHKLAALGGANLKSFDSGASGLTTDSTVSTLLTSELEEDPEHITQLQLQQQQQKLLEIKNKQLLPSYGTIFQQLVFLDLYDNQIERIANLDGLTQLTVLLLGKNRISDLSGLSSLRKTLRVLDLHGNRISSISNKINCLQDLKSLNLAGNQIRQINQNDFNGLLHLKELNLKRNRIKRINGFQHLSALERLWLCHNDLHKVDDMSSIAQAINLLEVTIENNPVSLAGDCVSFLVSYLPRLQSLSQMAITEQVRRAAMAWRKHKETSDATYSHLSSDVFNSVRREEVISNARTNWELLRSQQTVQATLERHQRSPKPARELTKINESTEAVGMASYEEFIKLPPIQQQQKQQQEQHQTQQQTQSQHLPLSQQPQIVDMPDTKTTEMPPLSRAELCTSGSSASSLGPNVDSCSSCYSSDNEESSPQQQQQTKLQRTAGGKRAQNLTAPSHEPTPMPFNSATALAANKDFGAATSDTVENGACESSAHERNSSVASTMPAASTSNPFASSTHTALSDSIKPQVHDAAATAVVKPDHLEVMNCNQAHNNSSAADNIDIDIAEANVTMRTQPVEAIGPAAPTNGGFLLATMPTMPTITTMAAIAVSATGATAPAALRSSSMAGIAESGSNSNSNNNGYRDGATTIPCLTSRAHNAACNSCNSGGSLAVTTTIGTKAAQPLLVHATTPTTPTLTMTTTTTTSKRYMSGSLIRSQTSVGGGNGNGSGSGKQSNLCRINTTKSNVALLSQPQSSAVAETATNTGSNKLGTCTANTPTALTTTTPVANSSNATLQVCATKTITNEREREQGGDYLIEICGRYLNVYGQGALRFIDKQWCPSKANDVHTLNFSYINFNNIAAMLSRIKFRFPHAENFVFRETNISCLGQLNALAELQGITSLSIDPEGNPITGKDLWRQYAIYRLSHWGLKLLNGAEVSATEVEQANCLYTGLSELVLWSMPDAMLQPLLARLRLDETCTESRMSPKDWLMKADASLQLVVGKEALQWKKLSTQQQQQQHSYATDVTNTSGTVASGGTAASGSGAVFNIRERGKMHFALMLENTCNAVEKLHKLETLWPSLLHDIVRNTLLDYSQLDVYLRNLMSDILK